VVLALGSAPLARTTADRAPEYLLKAVFLLNFARFVEWPRAAFDAPGEPIVIGILGNDPFGAGLDELVAAETIGGRPLVVRRYGLDDDTSACHILFVGGLPSDEVGRAMARLSGRHVLTVGEGDDFARASGMIQFVTIGSKLRLRINARAARAAGLEISSKLLRQGDVVGEAGGRR
jgi:hypothetical protein